MFPFSFSLFPSTANFQNYICHHLLQLVAKLFSQNRTLPPSLTHNSQSLSLTLCNHEHMQPSLYYLCYLHTSVQCSIFLYSCMPFMSTFISHNSITVSNVFMCSFCTTKEGPWPYVIRALAVSCPYLCTAVIFV